MDLRIMIAWCAIGFFVLVILYFLNERESKVNQQVVDRRELLHGDWLKNKVKDNIVSSRNERVARLEEIPVRDSVKVEVLDGVRPWFHPFQKKEMDGRNKR